MDPSSIGPNRTKFVSETRKRFMKQLESARAAKNAMLDARTSAMFDNLEQQALVQDLADKERAKAEAGAQGNTAKRVEATMPIAPNNAGSIRNLEQMNALTSADAASALNQQILGGAQASAATQPVGPTGGGGGASGPIREALAGRVQQAAGEARGTIPLQSTDEARVVADEQYMNLGLQGNLVRAGVNAISRAVGAGEVIPERSVTRRAEFLTPTEQAINRATLRAAEANAATADSQSFEALMKSFEAPLKSDPKQNAKIMGEAATILKEQGPYQARMFLTQNYIPSGTRNEMFIESQIAAQKAAAQASMAKAGYELLKEKNLRLDVEKKESANAKYLLNPGRLLFGMSQLDIEKVTPSTLTELTKAYNEGISHAERLDNFDTAAEVSASFTFGIFSQSLAMGQVPIFGEDNHYIGSVSYERDFVPTLMDASGKNGREAADAAAAKLKKWYPEMILSATVGLNPTQGNAPVARNVETNRYMRSDTGYLDLGIEYNKEGSLQAPAETLEKLINLVIVESDKTIDAFVKTDSASIGLKVDTDGRLTPAALDYIGKVAPEFLPVAQHWKMENPVTEEVDVTPGLFEQIINVAKAPGFFEGQVGGGRTSDAPVDTSGTPREVSPSGVSFGVGSRGPIEATGDAVTTIVDRLNQAHRLADKVLTGSEIDHAADPNDLVGAFERFVINSRKVQEERRKARAEKLKSGRK